MNRLALLLSAMFLVGCATVSKSPFPPPQPDAATIESRAATSAPDRQADTAVHGEIAAAQEARLQGELESLRAAIRQGQSLPQRSTFGSAGFVTGVDQQAAIQWLVGIETEIRRRAGAAEWAEYAAAAEFLRQRTDVEIHESQMETPGPGVVSRSAVDRYVTRLLELLSHASTDAQFRVTIEVLTAPIGATFELCREYAQNDCFPVATNAVLPGIFRGRYIYKIRKPGYHDVQAPLNLVNFGQSRLRCTLQRVVDSSAALPCTPE